MQTYAKINNFTILAITENEKLKRWTVGDRLGNRVTDRTFHNANSAIAWAGDNYVELVK